MTAKELKINYLDAKKAKTKFDMCCWMDRFHWKNIPWVHLMKDVLDKESIKSEYVVFLMSFDYV